MKKHLFTIIMLGVFLVGIVVLLYPTVSDYINSRAQSRVIASYQDTLAQLDNDKYGELLEKAREYNKGLVKKPNRYYFTEQELEEYESQLKVGAGSAIGYIDIEVIDVRLPLYLGTGEAVLQAGVGHIEGTSLPVGGVGTHAALSGHRGIPRAMLLTDLDQMEVGDRFTLTILNETLTYETDRILIVEPDDMSALEIDAEMDYVTLVTCTPYGVNSHRLLVRGHRVENPDEPSTVKRVTADAYEISSGYVAPVIAAPILIVLLARMLSKNKKRK